MKLLEIHLNGKKIKTAGEFLEELYIKKYNKCTFLFENEGMLLTFLEANVVPMRFNSSDSGCRFILNGNGENKRFYYSRPVNALENVDINIHDNTVDIDCSIDRTVETIPGVPNYDFYITFGDYQDFIPGDLAEDIIFVCQDYDSDLCSKQCRVLDFPEEEAYNDCFQGYCLKTGGLVTWKKIKG